jgi:hypothetical protein
MSKFNHGGNSSNFADLDISLVPDGALDRRFRDIRSNIYKLNEDAKNSRSRNKNYQNSIKIFEEEYCYLKREIEIRENRKKAHEDYLVSLSHN